MAGLFTEIRRNLWFRYRGSYSSSSNSDESEDVGWLRARNQDPSEEEQYSAEVLSTPSGISRNLNVSCRLSMRKPSRKGNEKQPLKKMRIQAALMVVRTTAETKTYT